MKFFPLFTSNKDKWSYIEKKGKVYFIIYQPIVLTVIVSFLIVFISFIFSLLQQGYTQTIEVMKENYPEKYYKTLIGIIVYWLVVIVTNSVMWMNHMKKNRKNKSTNPQEFK